MTASMEFIRKMPLPQEIKRDYPADRAIRTVKETRDREISGAAAFPALRRPQGGVQAVRDQLRTVFSISLIQP